jgi:hypothetical protein
MASNEIVFDLTVKGLDVPLMIIVDECRKVHIFENGKKVEAKFVDFHAGIDELPTLKIEKYVGGKATSEGGTVSPGVTFKV